MARTPPIDLDPETEARLRAQVENGAFAGAVDVIRAGLDLLESGGWSREELRGLIREAEAEAGDFSTADVEAFLDARFGDLEAKFAR